MFRNDPEFYRTIADEIEKETGQPPLFREVAAHARLLQSMPEDELRKMIEEERNRLQWN